MPDPSTNTRQFRACLLLPLLFSCHDAIAPGMDSAHDAGRNGDATIVGMPPVADAADMLEAAAPSEMGDAADAGPAAPIARASVCDGSSRIRLGYRVTAPASRVEPGAQLLGQNGEVFWIITGGCHFYVALDSAGGLRDGELQPDEAQMVAARVRAGELVSGDRSSSNVVSDGGRLVLELAGDTVSCAASCADAKTQQAFDAASAVGNELQKRGRPWTGPMRIYVIRTSVTFPGVAPVEWPLSIDPDTVAVSTDDAISGVLKTALIENADDVAALRKLRRTAAASDHRYVIAQGADGMRYELWSRDAIALEDGSGNQRREW